MSFFAYGHRKISPKVIGVTLFCVTILLLAEWTAFYRLKREHHEEMKCTCDYCTGKKEYHYEGVAGLAQGERMSMEPQGLQRHERNKK